DSEVNLSMECQPGKIKDVHYCKNLFYPLYLSIEVEDGETALQLDRDNTKNLISDFGKEEPEDLEGEEIEVYTQEGILQGIGSL
ncbi:MAG: hypothetical protein ABEJ72_07650, partial [Candidatus Aenigmatarchaeota archaeon]